MNPPAGAAAPRKGLHPVASLAIVAGLVALGWWLFRGGGRAEAGGLPALVRPTFRESLAGLDMGLQPSDREILVAEAPSIDFIRAGMRAQEEGRPDLEPPPEGTFLVADFDKDGETDREWTAQVGAWLSDPTDPTIRCLEAYDPVQRYGLKGYCLKLWYDIDSPNSAFGGLWLKLQNGTQMSFDATRFRAVRLMIKGTASAAGASSQVKMELKNARQEVGAVMVTGIGPDWRAFEIPLSDFRGLSDRSKITEMTIVLDREIATDLEGILYFDEIHFVE